MNEDKSTKYHRLQRRAAIASFAWSAALLVALAATPWSLRLRDTVTAPTESAALAVVLYVVALILLHEIGAFPLAFYSGYHLEHRYGLSRQTLGAWLADHMKGTAIGLALVVGLSSALYWTMRVVPGWWWLASGLGFAALLVIVAHLAPVLLLPVFFRFTPLEAPALRERLERLAERAGARVMGVFRWELGTKTSKANAALAGIGGTRRILIADTMLDHYSDDEIEVVLAHELAHHVHHDIWTGIAYETVLTLEGFYAAHRVLDWLGPRLGLTSLADPAGLPLLLLAAGGVSLVLMPAALALSRSHERRADRFALDLTRNPSAFSSAMRRLGVQNLAEERPSRLVQWLFYSHPPLTERLEAAARWQG
jgi:STE24 endopeptidase